MADSHEEQDGPIHQSPWVFFVTVGVCYAVLTLILGAKFLSSDSMAFGEVLKVLGLQAALFGGFAVLFGGLIFGTNRLLDATSGD